MSEADLLDYDLVSSLPTLPRHWVIHSFIHGYIHLFIHLFIRSCIDSFVSLLFFTCVCGYVRVCESLCCRRMTRMSICMSAGSRLLCMVYEKYVLGLAWRIELFPQCTAQLPESDKRHQATEASLVMLKSLSLWLQVQNSMPAVLRP